MVLDFKEDEDVPLILDMPFLYTTKAIIDVNDGILILRVGDGSYKFDVYQGMKYPFDNEFYMRVDVINDCVSKAQRWRLKKSMKIENIEKYF